MTQIFCCGKMMNIYTAAYSNNSSLQEVLNPLNCQAPEEYISILIGDDSYNLSECLAYISNSKLSRQWLSEGQQLQPDSLWWRNKSYYPWSLKGTQNVFFFLIKLQLIVTIIVIVPKCYTVEDLTYTARLVLLYFLISCRSTAIQHAQCFYIIKKPFHELGTI